MRFFLLVLSLLILFQPASWATGMPMFGHQQMDYASSHSMMLTASVVEGHCQAIDTEMTQAATLTDDSIQQGNHMLASCLAAGSSAVSLTAVATVAFEPQYFDIIYHTPVFSFYSHTESPEIRPPS
jgi:hypothetical protein